MKYHYTYLISNIKPQCGERYYIGSRSCECPPDEDIYMGSSAYLSDIITNEGSAHFEKIIIREDFSSREEADIHEHDLHQAYNVRTNPLFYNKHNAQTTFRTTLESAANASATVNSTSYKKSKGVTRSKRLKETFNSLAWKETTGYSMVKKRAATMATNEWQETAGANMKKKMQTTKSNPLWKATVGKEGARKRKELFNDLDWINENTFTCLHCNKSMTGRGNFNRWHNDNCKTKIMEY